MSEMEALIADGHGISGLDLTLCQAWVDQFQRIVSTHADEAGAQTRDYACTLVAGIIGSASAVFIQLGDGAIVVSDESDPDDYSWMFWPQKGEYENSTCFLTDKNARDKLLFDNVSGRDINDLAVLTDGLERLALHFPTQTAYAPFFRPMFKPLRAATRVGFLEELAFKLIDFLDSPQVNGRSDDDKTLVLASRSVHDDRTPRSSTGLDGTNNWNQAR